MELAKNLAHWRDQPPDQWIALANRILPPIIVALIVILIAAKAADLTWQLLETPSRQDVVPITITAPAGGSANTQREAYAALEGWRPFGEPPVVEEGAIAAEDILDAPETNLPLRLHGVVVVQDLPVRGTLVMPEAGAATIAVDRAAPETFQTGEDLQNAGGATLATLHSVYKGHVVLDRNGRLESLYFPKHDAESLPRAGAAGARTRITATNPREPARIETQPAAEANLLDTMSGIGTTLNQHMQITAAVENGQTIGYRLQPRGDSEVFGELGLEPGDVMTEVNGIPMTNLNNTAQIFQALGQTTQASVMIRRNGVDQAMVIDLSQIERIAQSLQ